MDVTRSDLYPHHLSGFRMPNHNRFFLISFTQSHSPVKVTCVLAQRRCFSIPGRKEDVILFNANELTWVHRIGFGGNVDKHHLKGKDN